MGLQHITKKSPKTLKTHQHRAAITYLVEPAVAQARWMVCLHAPAMPAVSQGRGDAARSGEDTAGHGRGGSAACLSPAGHTPPASSSLLARSVRYR
ncbi:hypothetical protein BDA96_03G165800 [Sorghum bicolor]|uniref:Uncharacterized protein n=2 Tax=Sorghum bicolor TaxID=4558 RepID=A0A921RC04_SORBI|nr:hypothetical protein BDA96_03G165800 [Sorghum bicolor]KXG32449.1 hypothetical protein SORBI_3003G156800 [Sorghum bicolor]